MACNTGRLLLMGIAFTVTFCGVAIGRHAAADEFDTPGGVYSSGRTLTGVSAQGSEPAAEASAIGWWDWDDTADDEYAHRGDFRKLLPVVQDVQTYSVPLEDFQRRITWTPPALDAPDRSTRERIWNDYRITGYVVKCKTLPWGIRGTRVASVYTRHATEAIVGTGLLGWNRGLVDQSTYRCGVAVKTTKGLGRFVYSQKTFIAGPQPPPPGATGVITYTHSASAWLVSGWTPPEWGAEAFRLQCVESGAGCNGTGAINSGILTAPPAAGTFLTLLGLTPGTAYDCSIVSYEDPGATVPFYNGAAGVCSAPTSFTTIPYSSYAFTQGPIGAGGAAPGQDGFWSMYKLSDSNTVVEGTEVSGSAAFDGSQSLAIGNNNCNNGGTCTAVNWLLHPMAPSGTSIDNGGWPSSGYAGKPSTGAPADRARMSFWVRTKSTSLPIIPQAGATTTDVSFSFEGLATEVMTWIGVRIFNNVPGLGSGVPYVVAVSWNGQGATGTQVVDIGPALTPGSWFNFVTNAEFKDGQYEDRVVYQVFDASGAKIWEVAAQSWEAPHFLFRPGYGVPTQIPITRRFQVRNRLGNNWVNADGGVFVDKLEVQTWNSAAPNTLLYQYSTSFEGGA